MASWILSRASASVSPAEAHPGSSGQTADQLSAMRSCSSTKRNFTFSVYVGARFRFRVAVCKGVSRAFVGCNPRCLWLARYGVFQVPAQILQNFLFALLNF